ncbi:MAG: hypothetical protein Q8P06_02585 [Candidatus Azambacteria bacterium]|nr:hypothetical protein [Candidatus Azambacteria bacterium]
MYPNNELKSNKYFIVASVILVFLIGLGMGFLLKNTKPSQIIIDKNSKMGLPNQAGQGSNSAQTNLMMGNFSASISGKAYYPKNCPSANRIKEENRIWFNTKQEAEAEGYAPAQNCAW